MPDYFTISIHVNASFYIGLLDAQSKGLKTIPEKELRYNPDLSWGKSEVPGQGYVHP